MERLHCIYYNAYAADGGLTNTEILGKLREYYENEIQSNPKFTQIYEQLIIKKKWISYKEVCEINEKRQPIKAFILDANFVTLPIDYFTYTENNEEKINKFLNVRTYGNLAPPLQEMQINALLKLTQRILQNRHEMIAVAALKKSDVSNEENPIDIRTPEKKRKP
jgi:hypothetical protein